MKLLLVSALVFVLAQTSFALTLQQQWGSFKVTHKKQYLTPTEEAYRMGVFQANLATIERHNQEHADGKQTWTMAVNHLADLTHDEFMIRNQLKVPDLPQRKQSYKMQAKVAAAEVDWRTKGYVTGVKDQGQCGSCWAFGAIASLEAAHFETHGELISLSEQQLVDCDSQDGGCNGGWYDTAWKYIKNEGGSNTETAYPYEARDGSCRVDSNGFVAAVSGCNGGPNFFCDNHGMDGDEANLVAALNDRPQAVAVDATYFQFYSGGVFHSALCSTSRLNHAVTAVGYGSDAGDDYYIVKNSWGASWGEDGYIRMARGTANMCGIANYPAYAIDSHF